MIAGCFIRIFKDLNGDEMIKKLEQYLAENDL